MNCYDLLVNIYIVMVMGSRIRVQHPSLIYLVYDEELLGVSCKLNFPINP